MHFVPSFQTAIGCSNPDEVFSNLIENLNSSIRYWDYFVNWSKVISNTKQIEIDLNTLNYLVGKEDVHTAFKELLRQDGRLARLVPVLLACRDCNFKILTDFSNGELAYENFVFKPNTKLSESEIEAVCRFADKTGLLEMFKAKIIKSVPDYVIGIEVGLDSNGRKNRGGTSMEKLVGGLIQPICIKNRFAMMRQATAAKLKIEWGINLSKVDGDRGFDFAVNTQNKLFLIETNYFSGGGSKLKSVAGEFQMLSAAIKEQGHGFIWITDGFGWRTCKEQLWSAFQKVDYVLNIDMVLKGILESILVCETGQEQRSFHSKN